MSPLTKVEKEQVSPVVVDKGIGLKVGEFEVVVHGGGYGGFRVVEEVICGDEDGMAIEVHQMIIQMNFKKKNMNKYSS